MRIDLPSCSGKGDRDATILAWSCRRVLHLRQEFCSKSSEASSMHPNKGIARVEEDTPSAANPNSPIQQTSNTNCSSRSSKDIAPFTWEVGRPSEPLLLNLSTWLFTKAISSLRNSACGPLHQAGDAPMQSDQGLHSSKEENPNKQPQRDNAV